MSKSLKFKKLSLAILGIFSITSCNKIDDSSSKSSINLLNAKIEHDTKFDAANVIISIEEFNNLGFNFGDSCNVIFSNGAQYLDIPYFNGYYVKNGEPVIVGYPSNKYLTITLNNVGIWDIANLNEDYTVSIYLQEAKKYLPTQLALGQAYSLNRAEYTSDEEFSNFRALKGGNLKDNLIYRGASPVDNSRNRASITNSLLEKNKINCIIDLADSSKNMETYLSDPDFNSNYTKSIYEDNRMILLSMSSSYTSLDYKQKVVNGFRFMLKNDGPYYIHCMEGKDRTGFVCTLIEALLGASYDQMCEDYMITYYNYFKISKENCEDRYDAVVDLYFNSFMETLYKDPTIEILKKASYVDSAKQYLYEGGMSLEEINQFIKLFSK